MVIPGDRELSFELRDPFLRGPIHRGFRGGERLAGRGVLDGLEDYDIPAGEHCRGPSRQDMEVDELPSPIRLYLDPFAGDDLAPSPGLAEGRGEFGSKALPGHLKQVLAGQAGCILEVPAGTTVNVNQTSRPVDQEGRGGETLEQDPLHGLLYLEHPALRLVGPQDRGRRAIARQVLGRVSAVGDRAPLVDLPAFIQGLE